MTNRIISSVIKEWKEDAGVSHIILFDYKYSSKTLKVFTDRPGPLIGLRGERFDRFNEKLKRCISPDLKIEFVETTGVA